MTQAPTPVLDLAGITARAAWPFERLSLPGAPGPASEGRLDTWARQLLGRNATRAALLDALAAQGLSPEEVQRVVGDPLPGIGPVPAWARVLEDVLLGLGSSPRPDPGTGMSDVAFGEVLAPFTAYFRDRLPGEAWTPEVGEALAHDLAVSLSRWSGRVLYAAFQARLPVRSGLTEMLERAAGTPPSTERYRQFVVDLHAGGLVRILEEHPALARALAQLTAQHLDAARELHDRLVADAPALQELLRRDSPPGLVTAVSLDGDPHGGGRRVAVLTFAGGDRVVYKPRSVAMEAAFNELIAWLNVRTVPERLRTYAVLDRASYGWVEHVAAQDCQDEASVGRFYRRAGKLLCLLHLLEATDAHHENVVAAGEHPVLVDAETLFHHRDAHDEFRPPTSAHEQAHATIFASASRTGYLPFWALTRDGGTAFDGGGLTGGQLGRTPDRVSQWVEPNTDRMSVVRDHLPVPPSRNLPRVGGQVVGVERFTEEVRAGYRAMYDQLLEVRDELGAPDGPLERFRGLASRIVLRPTSIYGALLAMLWKDPVRLRDGFETGVVLEQLGRAHLSEPVAPQTLAIERRGLYRLDVPVFTARTDSTDLHGDDGTVVPGYFSRPSHDVVRERIAAMSPADRDAQLQLIDAVLQVHVPSGARLTAYGRSDRVGDDGGVDRLAVATAIAEQLDRHALRGADGSLSWVAPQLVPLNEQLQLQPLTAGLYDGLAGVAVFRAALHRATGRESEREAALGCWRTVREHRRLSPVPERPFSYLGTGAANGLGSLLYAGVLLADFLEDDGFLEEAVGLAATVDRGVVRSAVVADVMGGPAGLLLGLLAVHERTGDAHVLRTARACGDELRRTQVRTPVGGRGWPQQDGTLLAGMSHGPAGIAHALLRLHAVTGDDRYRETARLGVAYESALFESSVGNWPDLRHGPTTFTATWCHGGPGIAMARAATGGAEGLADVEAGLALTRQMLDRDRPGDDHLCCGRFGLVDVLLTVGQLLGRADLVEEARARGDRITAAAGPGGFTYSDRLPPTVFVPGLFSGAAGVGYEQLRLTGPDDFPSVLLFGTRPGRTRSTDARRPMVSTDT